MNGLKASVDKKVTKGVVNQVHGVKPNEGDIVLRPVKVIRGRLGIVKEVLDGKFQISTKENSKDTVLRIFFNGWWIVSSTERGIVCFCKQPIPADWTHFVITKVAANGSFCIVEPRVGDKQKLLDSYEG